MKMIPRCGLDALGMCNIHICHNNAVVFGFEYLANFVLHNLWFSVELNLVDILYQMLRDKDPQVSLYRSLLHTHTHTCTYARMHTHTHTCTHSEASSVHVHVY